MKNLSLTVPLRLYPNELCTWSTASVYTFQSRPPGTSNGLEDTKFMYVPHFTSLNMKHKIKMNNCSVSQTRVTDPDRTFLMSDIRKVFTGSGSYRYSGYVKLYRINKEIIFLKQSFYTFSHEFFHSFRKKIIIKISEEI